MNINWDTQIWNIIDNYFNTVPNYLSRVQLDSYNIFLSQQVPKTIRQFNPITTLYYSQQDNTKVKFKIEFYVGASTNALPDAMGNYPDDSKIINDGKRIYIKKPIIQEKQFIDGDKVMIKKQLYPNESRLKNLTYKTDINVDVFVKLSSYFEHGELESQKTKFISNVSLGSIPIMLHSNICVLNDMKKETLYTMGECPYDQGGYFIIDGKEKVIVAQERQVENKLYIKQNKNIENKYSYEMEIRSVPETIFQPARITKAYITNQTEEISLVIPNINGEIPIFIVFRALGIISDLDIIKLIVGDVNSQLSQELMAHLRESILASTFINTQQLAFEYLIPRLVIYGSQIHNKKVEYAFLQDILRNYLIPHTGRDFLPKAHFIGYMIRELLLTKLGVKKQTDKDSFINKRVDISGYLIGNIFRDLYFRVKKKIEENINIHYYTPKPSTLYWQSGDVSTYPFWNIINSDIIQSNNSIMIHKLIERQIIDKGFNYAFKNCWGLQNATGKCKEGVVQDLNRLNYLGSISHVRRVNMTLSASAKIREPHSLHASSYGIICPDETPDGGNIGLRKNIALFAKVTFDVNSQPLFKVLITENVIPLYNYNVDWNECKVFLNERLVGFHKNPEILVYRLKLFRRNALINVYTSIAWYCTENIIKISTDSGRCTRPLLIVNKNNIKLTEEMINNIGVQYNWKNLIGGFKPENSENIYLDYDDKYHCLSDMSNEYLEEHSGVIEYIDTEEANTCLIAMFPNELYNKSNTNCKFTHCEIHPSLMFGILANNVPFIERNQHPRNQYSTAQGKQALGIYTTNFRNRMDTKGQIMYYPQKPLVQSKISKYLHNNDLPHGINAIVAIGCYSGYNQEDSILFNKDSVQRGLFTTIKFRTYSNREEILDNKKKIQEKFAVPNSQITKNIKNGNYTKLESDENSLLYGIVKEGEKINENDILIGKIVPTTEKNNEGETIYVDNSNFVKRNEAGFVDKVYVNYGNDGQKYAKVRVRKEKIPEVGDKFCSRYGQKGTIGMLIEARDMPVTKDGIIPDLIVNPHAIPSRMTLGQLLEVILGKTCSNIGTNMELAAFVNENVEDISDILEEKCHYERNANEVLYNGRTGEQLKVSLFIGPTFYQRLTHQVADKFYSRNEGTKAALTHQPVGGRAAGGGLRIGEMERDAILAHGLSMFLKESMMERADKYRFYISDKSGLLAIVNKDKHIYEDFSNDELQIKINNENNTIVKKSSKISDATFYCIEAPYAFKLFLQEIESMGVAPRLIVESSKNHWPKIQNISIHEYNKLKSKNIESVKKGYYQTQGSNLTIPLRSYHNKIKSILVYGSNKHNVFGSLLDLSVGRGGDLDKWYRAGYNNILGVDIDRMGIEAHKNKDGFDGAKTRLENLKVSRDSEKQLWANTSNIDFIVADTSKNIRKLKGVEEDYKNKLMDVLNKNPLHSFDTISSQFSIHYYFNSIERIQDFFINVKENIKKGGYFITTCLDGDVVYNKLKQAKEMGNLPLNGSVLDKNNKNINIWSINTTEETRLEDERLSDTLTLDSFNNPISVEFESIGHPIIEYLVSSKLLINIAAKYGFKLLSSKETRNNFDFLKYSTGLFKDIYSSIKQNVDEPNINKLENHEYQELKEYSNMHRYYIFKYMDDSIIENSFSDIIECKKFMLTKSSVNPIYIPYNQYILTAGNTSQLHNYLVEQRVYYGSGNYINDNSKSILNMYNNGEPSSILNERLTEMLSNSLYQNIDHDSFSYTLKYMFENMKYGIFVKIKNGILTMFSPFFNSTYKNKLTINDIKFIDLTVDPEKYPGGIIQYYKEKNKYKNVQKDLKNIKNPNNWWLDNCILHLFGEDTNLSTTYFGELKHMLETLCTERGDQLSDVEFFINKQKFPYLSKPNQEGILMEPYFHASGENVPLKNNAFNKYMPILSTSSSDKYMDILMPSAYEWNISTNEYYPPECNNSVYKLDLNTIGWDKKIPKVYFRGASCGCGVTEETNQRIKIKKLEYIWNQQIDKKDILEIILTNWSQEDTVYMGNYLDFQRGINSNNIKNDELVDPYGIVIDSSDINEKERVMNMKYLLYIDDYVASDLFTEYLSLGSLILKTTSTFNYKLWYFDLLEPLNDDKTNWKTATHININEDFSNLFEVIQWCKINDKKIQKIATNSFEFYKKYINKESILDYFQVIVNNISKNIQNNLVNDNVFDYIISEEIIEDHLMFPIDKLGFIYGKKGINLKRLQTKTDTTIFINQKQKKEHLVRINIKGFESNVMNAKKEIIQISKKIIQKELFKLSKLGILIGKGGRNIKSIINSFEVSIIRGEDIKDKQEWTIIGQSDNVKCAIKSLRELENDTDIMDKKIWTCMEDNVLMPEIELPMDDMEEFGIIKHRCGIIIPIFLYNDLSEIPNFNSILETITNLMNKQTQKINEVIDIFSYNIFLVGYNDEGIFYKDKEGNVIHKNIPSEILSNTTNNHTEKSYFKVNRGALINTGVKMAIEDSCDYVIIHHFDLLPNDELIKEYCVYPNHPINISSVLDKYDTHDYQFKEHYNVQLGILKMNIKQFMYVNGYPNDMWGLGYEDYIFVRRCEQSGIDIQNIIFNRHFNITDYGLINIDPKNKKTFNTYTNSHDIDFYVSSYLSGVTQPTWFSIYSSIPLFQTIDMHYIHFNVDILLPLRNTLLTSYISSLYDTCEINRLTYNDTINDLLNRSLLTTFNINKQVKNNKVIILNDDILLNKFKMDSTLFKSVLDMYKENFYNRTIELIKIIKEQIILLDSFECFYDLDKQILNFDITITSVDDEYFEINIIYDGSTKVNTKNIKYKVLDNSFITFRHQSIVNIPMNDILKERLKIGTLQFNRQKELDQDSLDKIKINKENIDLSLVIDIIGKYAILYNKQTDYIDIYDLVNNVVEQYLSGLILEDYNVFLNLLDYKIKHNRLVVPKYNSLNYNDIRLELNPIYEPTTPDYQAETPTTQSLYEPTSYTDIPEMEEWDVLSGTEETKSGSTKHIEVETSSISSENKKPKKIKFKKNKKQKPMCLELRRGPKGKTCFPNQPGCCLDKDNKHQCIWKSGKCIAKLPNVSDIVQLIDGRELVVISIEDDTIFVGDIPNGENPETITLRDIKNIKIKDEKIGGYVDTSVYLSDIKLQND